MKNVYLLLLSVGVVWFGTYAQPVNNNPCGAIELTPNATCQFQQFTNNGATVTSSPSQPGCHNGSLGCSSPGDVWFRFTVNSADPYYINTGQVSGGMSDPVISVYAGDVCANPGGATLLACVDDGAAGSSFPDYVVSGQPLGTQIYVRVSHYRGGLWPVCTGSGGAFNICVSETMCGGVAMPGQSCQTATPICDLDGYCARTTGYTANVWSQLTSAFCGSIENNSFLTFVAAATTVNLQVTVSACANSDGIQFFVFSAATCGSGSVNTHLCNGQMNPGLNNLVVNGLTPGQTYFLMIDGFAGDVCTYNITVPENGGILLPVATNDDLTICEGNNTTLSVTGGQGPYTWTDNFGNNLGTGSSISVSPTVTTTYTVTGIAGNPLCPNSSSDEVTVTVAPPLTITANGTGPTTCGGNDGSITISGLLGNTSYQVSLNGNNSTATSSPGGQIPIGNLTTGSYSVSVSLNGCGSNVVAIDLSDPIVIDPPSLAVVPSNMVCVGESVVLTATGENGATFNWTAPSGCGSSASGTYTVSDITGTCGGVYQVTQTTMGCTSAPASVTITVNDLPVLDAGTYGPFCLNDPVVTLNPTPSGGVFSGTGVSGNAFSPSSGTQTITYNYTDANGCSNSTTTTITVNAVPVVDAGIYAPVCVDADDVQLIGTPVGGVFSGIGVTSTSFDPSVGSQTITYTYEDANGCSSSANSAIVVNNLPLVSAGVDVTICEGQQVTLSGSGANSYQWEDGLSNGSAVQPSLGINYYVVSGTDQNGCQASDTLWINVLPMPVASVFAENTVGYPVFTVDIVNISSNANSYFWSFGNGASGTTFDLSTETGIYGDPGTYWMTLIADNGYCSDTDSLQIVVLPYPDPVVIVPNVFTPNGDGNNDFFYLLTENVTELDLLIVNRWGNVMFQSTPTMLQWDGLVNGNEASAGVYFFRYRAVGINGTVLEGHGNVTLVR